MDERGGVAGFMSGVLNILGVCVEGGVGEDEGWEVGDVPLFLLGGL